MAQAQPDVSWTWTPSHFTLLPEDLPPTVPPPLTEASLRAPFGIPPSLYNFALRPEIPVVFAAVYVITIFYLNAHNKRHHHAPWDISRRQEFGYFVIAHNLFLALYSFTTFIALGRAAAQSLPSWDADHWNVRTADALCKLHGPRGLGDAATFNTSINIWEVKNTAIKLTGTGIPDPTDVGRLWNEGLAFWGWFFYVSKFYEVVDTFIVLAKGKRSATLQTYHHAGAMLCMWAGIRYMSPPIWMFVFVNSGIHALMYSYFTASALNIHVPPVLKRTLTMLQITQFVWGASYAAAHLFIQYDIPIATPFQVVHAVQRAASSAQSAVSSATSAVSSAVEESSPTATAVLGWYLKKLLLRAAGEEGVAERLALQNQNPDRYLGGMNQNPLLNNLIPNTSPKKLEEKMHHFIEHRFETRYKQDWTKVNCIDTTGEAFAIYLNLLYLSPLTWLFVRFFIRAYSQRERNEKRRTASQVVREIETAAREARKQTTETFERGGEDLEELVDEGSREAEEEVRKDVEKVVKELRSGSGLQAGMNKVEEVGRSVVETVGRTVEEVKEQVAAYSSTSATQQESSSITTTTTSTSSSSFKQQEKVERQSSSTWIKGGGGLFRRSWTDDAAGDGEDTVLSEERQDENLETSQATRPEPEEDSDVMGRSGVNVQAEGNA